MARTAELVVGIIGGVFGILGALVAFVGGGFVAAVGEDASATSIMGRAILALAASILGIVASVLLRDPGRRRLWSAIAIASGAIVLFAIGGFGIVGGPMLAIAGLMGFLRKDPEEALITTGAPHRPQPPPIG